MLAEEILVKQSLQGDTLAFEELISPYQSKIYALAFRYMNNEEDAYDMTQEAFIKAFRSLRSFKGDSSFGTWIYRVTANVCLDELRRRKRRISTLSLDEPLATQDGETVGKEIADQQPTQDIIFEQQEFSQYIQHLVGQMKPEHKNVIILRDMMQMSYEEIAGVLDTSIGTVKSRLSRARNILRKKLANREHLP